jgi:long-chain fatty acid transport protein
MKKQRRCPRCAPRLSRLEFPAFALLLLWLAALVPETARGLGVRIPNQDAAAIARGNAFVATADNPSALYYNPAGITQLEGHHVQFGVLNYLGITSEYRAPGGRKTETKYEITPVPQLYYVFSPKQSALSYGLGIYAPFGLGLEWPEDSGFRTMAIEGRLTFITINPTVAWQVHRTLSIAAGPTINYSRAKLRQGVVVPSSLVGVMAVPDEFRFRGDDYGFGAHVGMRWEPCEQWAFGVNYRSPTSMKYEGTTDLTFPTLMGQIVVPQTATTAELEFPQNVSFGVSYRPTPNWSIEVAADWTDWSSVGNLVFQGTTDFTGGPITLPLNWRASWFYHLGATRTWANGYFASIGYFFSQNSTSEQNFSPYVPDTDLHVGSLGGGRRGKNWDWALAFQMITGPRRLVDESQSTSRSPAIESANGHYRFFVPAATFSVGYHF